MPPPPAPLPQAPAAPRFYLTPRQRMGPFALLLAFVLALACLLGVTYALRHAGHAHASGDDDDDDPSRVDTIYLGDPTEAPRATRPKQDTQNHPNAVHPFVVVHLPRTGDGTGQIPDTPAGHLLYAWLAAFNVTDPAVLPEALSTALPTTRPTATGAAQLELRRQTGGFTLLSAKEVAPGILVFRLHDQTPAATEALGTLQLNPNTHPPTIATFSLSAISPTLTKPR